jgi:predicted RNA-binding protein (virulence factor B family)
VTSSEIHSQLVSAGTFFDGLSLFVSVTGAKTWHFRYTRVGQRARISLGCDKAGRVQARSPYREWLLSGLLWIC